MYYISSTTTTSESATVEVIESGYWNALGEIRIHFDSGNNIYMRIADARDLAHKLMVAAAEFDVANMGSE